MNELFEYKSYPYQFGDKLMYLSPKVEGLETPCVFIRDDQGQAVIFFKHAEWAARVNYRFLRVKE